MLSSRTDKKLTFWPTLKDPTPHPELSCLGIHQPPRRWIPAKGGGETAKSGIPYRITMH